LIYYEKLSRGIEFYHGRYPTNDVHGTIQQIEMLYRECVETIDRKCFYLPISAVDVISMNAAVSCIQEIAETGSLDSITFGKLKDANELLFTKRQATVQTKYYIDMEKFIANSNSCHYGLILANLNVSIKDKSFTLCNEIIAIRCASILKLR